MHKCIGFVVSSVAVSSLAASKLFFDPSSNRMFEPASNRIFERVFERGASEREVSEREVSERLRYPIPWAGQLDNTFWTSVLIDFCRAFWWSPRASPWAVELCLSILGELFELSDVVLWTSCFVYYERVLRTSIMNELFWIFWMSCLNEYSECVFSSIRNMLPERVFWTSCLSILKEYSNRFVWTSVFEYSEWVSWKNILNEFFEYSGDAQAQKARFRLCCWRLKGVPWEPQPQHRAVAVAGVSRHLCFA